MEKMDKNGLSIIDINVGKIVEMIPECQVDGKIDFDILRTALGDYVETDNESYSFNWNGKARSVAFAKMPSSGTLIPCKEKSKEWGSTKNIYVEGDNCEVLKILSKTYHRKVKFIYIDPPYNTGKDFVYHDDFRDNISNYLEESGQNYKTNPETAGRYHTDWLNMMYPRLKLAEQMLSEDGLIFISINEVELTNLSKLCDMIFGEDNCVAKFIWENTANPNATSNNVGITHEYVLCYAKSDEVHLNLLPLSKEDLEEYTGKDEYLKTRGPYKLVGLNKTGTVTDLRPNLQYDIVAPDGSIIKPNPRWRWSREKFERGLQEGRIVFNKSGSKTTVYYKQYLNEDTEGNPVERGNLIKSIFVDCGRTTNGTLEVADLLGKGIFDFPKPVDLIKRLISISVRDNDIVMDFFSGSATTAHATFLVNAEENKNLKFVLVQLPEIYDENSEAYKKGYRTLCDVGEDRIRKAGEQVFAKLESEKADAGLFSDDAVDPTSKDFGFKVFKLTSTNIVPWDGSNQYDESNLLNLNDVFIEGRTKLDVAYEVMLKYGVFDKQLEEKKINGKDIFCVDNDSLVIFLEDEINMDDVKEIIKLNPTTVVFKESGFADDNVKMNAEYTLRHYLGEDQIKVLCI